MRIELLKLDMQELGVNSDVVLHGSEFVSHFEKIDLSGYPTHSITAYLREEPGAAFFTRTPDGNININLSGFRAIDRAAHIYVHYILRTLKKNHADFRLLVQWDSIDLYLRNTFDFAMVLQTFHHVGLFNYFHHEEFGLGVNTTCGFPYISLGSTPRFFARPGNVELRAARIILRHPDEIDEICGDILANWEVEEFMYKSNTSSDVAVADHHHAIRQLITNAGMYGTDVASLAGSLRMWANRYISGLFGAEELFMRWDYAMHSHAVRLAAAEAGLTFVDGGRARFGTVENFYAQMAGKTVLMISPFAAACVYSVNSGTIKKIWKKRQVPDFSLVGLPSYITTYPHRPHGSWNSTFDILCRAIDKIVSEQEVDLVIGSCGCYGIPLLDYCFKRHGISAVYYGNFMHVLFGIRQNDFSTHMNDANEEVWLDPFMDAGEVPTNLERIDDGRYVSPSQSG